MADYAPTSISRASTLTRYSEETAGETLAAMDVVYKKASDGKVYKADADAGVAEATVYGLLLDGAASADDPVLIVTSGPVTLGGVTFTLSDIVFASGTAGKMMPDSDLATNDYVGMIGMPTATNVLDVSIKNFGHQIP